MPLLTLRRARDVFGGVSLLARRLGVPPDDLDAMLHRRAPIPTLVLIRVVDALIDAGHPPFVSPPPSHDSSTTDKPR